MAKPQTGWVQNSQNEIQVYTFPGLLKHLHGKFYDFRTWIFYDTSIQLRSNINNFINWNTTS